MVDVKNGELYFSLYGKKSITFSQPITVYEKVDGEWVEFITFVNLQK
jgi:hypothetical protein